MTMNVLVLYLVTNIIGALKLATEIKLIFHPCVMNSAHV